MLIEQIIDIQRDFRILKGREVIKPVAQHHIRHGIPAVCPFRYR